MSDCLFCKIARGEIPSDTVYEDEDVIAFRDIATAAPVHILVIPKSHIDGLDTVTAAQRDLTGKLVTTAAAIAEQQGLSAGWRLISNVGEDGGQTVRHLHFHVIGGAKLNAKLA